jgi:hypothetical protein
MNERTAIFYAELLKRYACIEAMKAANEMRKIRGCSLAYEDAFFHVELEIEKLIEDFKNEL